MVWYARYLSQYKSAFTLDDGFDTCAFNLVVLFCFVELLTSNLFVHCASCLSEVGNQVM